MVVRWSGAIPKEKRYPASRRFSFNTMTCRFKPGLVAESGQHPFFDYFVFGDIAAIQPLSDALQ